MKLVLDLDAVELTRDRRLTLLDTPIEMAFANEPRYRPVRQFIEAAKREGGYGFILQDLLHITAIKMFARQLNWSSATVSHNLSLFAVGGLYLALDISHPNLCLGQHLGDFLSGFSHQIGVGMTAMVASQAYKIPVDSLGPIPVGRNKTLDYFVHTKSDDASDLHLYIEAKGTSSKGGSSRALRSGRGKKAAAVQELSATQKANTAMIIILTQIAKNSGSKSGLLVADPLFDIDEDAYDAKRQRAGRYLHYASTALFAGMAAVAEEFLRRARSIITGQQDMYRTRYTFPDGQLYQSQLSNSVIGYQWQFGSTCNGESIWFYHGFDGERLRMLIESVNLPETNPFPIRQREGNPSYPPAGIELQRDDQFSSVGSLLPDGCYFGIGNHPKPGFEKVDPYEYGKKPLSLVKLE